jgi:hypothetical protein
VEDDARLGLREHVADLRRAIAEVDRDVDGAELRRGEVDPGILDAVHGDRRHAIAVAHAELAEHVREPVRHGVELRVRHAGVPDHVGGPRAAVAGVPPQDLAEQERHPRLSSTAGGARSTGWSVDRPRRALH